MEECYDYNLEEIEKEKTDEKIKHILAEIEDAVSVGYLVEDIYDCASVYLASKDMLEGEFLPVPKITFAEILAENMKIYEEWKSDFNEYRESHRECILK